MAGEQLMAIAADNEPLDALIWRSAGAPSGAVEHVLETNPGLADLGPFLPGGTQVRIPLEAVTAPEAPLVQLWS